MLNSRYKKEDWLKKNSAKDRRVAQINKLTNHAVSYNTIAKLVNRIYIKLQSNKKDYLERRSRPSYLSKKKKIWQWFSHWFDNDLMLVLIV